MTTTSAAAPAPLAPAGRLERVLRAGHFAVTTELAPPDSADPAAVLSRARPFDGCVDAINVTDGSGAHCHMSSLAASALLAREGYEPVMQVTCRDRNRIALQADIVGAAALGVRNLLLLRGDGVEVGDHPWARPVFDLDSVSLLGIVRGLRDDARYESGRPLETPPRLFLGAAENPLAPPLGQRVPRLERKLAAGAQFVQTQYCFDVDALRGFLQEVEDAGLAGRVYLLVGVGPLRSAAAAEWMRTHLPGVQVPDEVVARLAGARDPARAGVDLCVELVEQMRGLRGVHGVHVMAHRQEHTVAEIVERSGALRGRPAPARADADDRELAAP